MVLGRAQVVTAEEERLAALGSLIDTLGDVTPEIKAQYLAKKAKNTTLLRIQPLQITGKASRVLRPGHPADGGARPAGIIFSGFFPSPLLPFPTL